MKIKEVKKINNEKYLNLKRRNIVRRKILKDGFDKIVISADKDAD